MKGVKSPQKRTTTSSKAVGLMHKDENITVRKESEKGSDGGESADHRHTVRLNVGGQIFEVFKSTILNKPKTRLYWLVANNRMGHTTEDIDYRDGELFFNRDPMAFHFILQYYRTGKLHSPLSMCGPAFQEELYFWQIDEDAMEPCCWPTYESHMQAAETITQMHQMQKKKEEKSTSDQDPCCSILDKVGKNIRSGLEKPSSHIAKTYVVLSTIFTVTTVINVSLISMPQLRTRNGTMSPYIFKPAKWTVRELLVNTEPHYALLTIDFVCNLYFIIEFIFLLVAAKSLTGFIFNVINIVDFIDDILVIHSYCYILAHPQYKLDWFVSFYVARITRIIRLFRHISGLDIIFYTFRASLHELCLLMSLFGICAVLLGATLYLCEQIEESPANKVTHIPISFYWAIISLTTVGYGDFSPTSGAGFIIGCLTAVMAILVIVLPVPIIANNFCLFYSHAQARLRCKDEGSDMTQIVSVKKSINKPIKGLSKK